MTPGSVPPVPRRWVGARVPRREDGPLIIGRGSFIADLTLPGTLHLAVLRSPHGHATIRSVDTRVAEGLPGVFTILTGADFQASAHPLPTEVRDAPGMNRTAPIWAMARDRARYVGEPVAAVLAEDRYVAEDALELIEVDYDPLPAAADVEAALAPGAPLLYEEWGDNVQSRFSVGSGDVDAALDGADVVVSERFQVQRQAGTPIETRGVLASYDATESLLTLRSSTQVPHLVRMLVAGALGFPEARVRVIAAPPGGGFGAKSHTYPEEVLASWLACRTGRPVKWVEDRREHFISAVHSRQQVQEITLGARHDGTLVAMRARIVADMGATMHTTRMAAPLKTATTLPGPYRLDAYTCEVLGVVTNKVPAGAYRGMGAPEAVFGMERMLDLLAHRLGLDPAEVRRRNLLHPSELPYSNPSGQHVYDSGDYPAALARALVMADYDGVRSRQAAWRAEGRRVGIGLACYVEPTASPGIVYEPCGPGTESEPRRLAAYETVIVHLDQTARATVYTALMGIGQGIETALAQVVADELGIHPSDVRVVLGDTGVTPFGPTGSIAARSMALGGGAATLAGTRLREKLKRLAAHSLEVVAEDLEFVDGQFRVRGAPARSRTVQEVARIAYSPSRLPGDEEVGLEATGTYQPRGRPYSYGVHVAEVEVEPATGVVHILRYVVVDDCGVVVNPTIVEGQLHGGIAQGVAAALYEDLAYDDTGQLLSASFMDYLLPTAVEIPEIELDHLEIPSTINIAGIKGVGESGVLAPPPAIANAIADALRPLAVRLTETPITPARLWAACQAASG